MKTLNYKFGKVKHSENNSIMIGGFEPYFNEFVWVGTINHENKTIRANFGYFYPHKYGKEMKNCAKSMNYKFIQ
jgi:hypothetical protein